MSTQSCSRIFGQTLTTPNVTTTSNPFANDPLAVIVTVDYIKSTIDSTGSKGTKVRGVIKRGGVEIETTASELNNGFNQISFSSTLENGDEICVEASNNDFAYHDTACLIIPSPAFSFMPSCPIISIENILISGDITISIDGATTQLNSTIIPPNAAIQTLIWTSSNPSIATVNQQGLVTPHSDGIVTIYATANDGSGIVGSHIIELSNQTTNTILISDVAPNGGTIIQYDELIGLEENQIEFFRDGFISPSNSYDLQPNTGVIKLLIVGDIFEGEDIEIRLI